MAKTSNPKTALERAQEEDKALPANCFEIGRYGALNEGIVLETDKGPNLLRPWEPFVLVGTFRLPRDFWNDKEKGPLGCLYYRESGVTFVRRAILHRLESGMRTLRRVNGEDSATILLKVNLVIPNNGKVYSKDGEHCLSLQAGIHTVGAHAPEVVKSDSNELLLQFSDGDVVNVLFPDGMVRRLKRVGLELVEKHLSSEEMANVRVEDAIKRLGRAHINSDAKKICYDMADLLLLTEFVGNDGQDVRRLIIRKFFLEISDTELNQVHRKVTAILYKIDPVLVPMLQKGPQDDDPDSADVNLSCLANKFVVKGCKGKKPSSTENLKNARKKMNAKKAERSEHDRKLRKKMRGSS